MIKEFDVSLLSPNGFRVLIDSKESITLPSTW